MIGLVRAATVCATLAFGLVAAQAADKAFKRDDLADSAIKLEAQIKSEAGAVAKTSATLKTDADAAFRRNDFRTGLQILGQIVATTPDDSANWLRLARTIFQIRPANSSEQTFLFERASTAAYIAYQRAANASDEADALAVLGRAMSERRLWRPALDSLRLSLDLREVADVRGQYEKLRDEHGFRLLDYTVVVDTSKAVGDRCTPKKKALGPLSMAKGKGGSAPNLKATTPNEEAQKAGALHTTPAPEI